MASTPPDDDLQDASRQRSALIVSHAQHVFKVLGWVQRQPCRVTVLTDGSGAGPWGKPHTERLRGDLLGLGARPSSMFGLLPDATIYQALLGHDVRLFTDIADRIADDLERDGTEFVFGDAVEGYNPAHDLCRFIVDAAVTIAEHRSGRRIANHEFFLAEWIDAAAKAPRPGDLEIVLDERRLGDKIATALKYDGWKPEISEVIAKFGPRYFAKEFLRPASAFAAPLHGERPEYESFGEERVADGGYSEVIRYRRHVRPMLLAIEAHALEAIGVRARAARLG
ncbi:MAG TPA: hypothetical protein VII56_15530 [Rhizomicrobium sp.]